MIESGKYINYCRILNLAKIDLRKFNRYFLQIG